MIDITYHLITNNSPHTFLDNFASIHPNSLYYSLFEKAEFTAHAYKFHTNLICPSQNIFVQRSLWISAPHDAV